MKTMAQFAVILPALLLGACATMLPAPSEDPAAANLLAVRLTLNGTAVSAHVISSSVPGGFSAGMGFSVHSGEPTRVSLLHRETRKVIQPTAYHDGICHFVNLPNGTYELHQAAIDSERSVPLSKYGVVSAVARGTATYMGSYRLVFGSDTHLDRATEAETTDRAMAQSYLDSHGGFWKLQ